METAAISSFLFMGLALGVVHAFDPDHLAALGGLSIGERQQSSFFGKFRFAIHWSMGHGSALLIFSILVFAAGKAIPITISAIAEHCVAFMLIAIGLLAFWRLKTRTSSSASRFSAPVVGLIHGTAGSAPLLALIPVSQLNQPLIGVAYVLFFSAGVVLAMMVLGGVFAHSMRIIQRNYKGLHGVAQGVLAAFSLSLGIFLALSNA